MAAVEVEPLRQRLGLWRATARIGVGPARSGRATTICRSKRTGRRSADREECRAGVAAISDHPAARRRSRHLDQQLVSASAPASSCLRRVSGADGDCRRRLSRHKHEAGAWDSLVRTSPGHGWHQPRRTIRRKSEPKNGERKKGTPARQPQASRQQGLPVREEGPEGRTARRLSGYWRPRLKRKGSLPELCDSLQFGTCWRSARRASAKSLWDRVFAAVLAFALPNCMTRDPPHCMELSRTRNTSDQQNDRQIAGEQRMDHKGFGLGGGPLSRRRRTPGSWVE